MLLGRVETATEVGRLVELRLLDPELVGRTLRRDLAGHATLERRRPRALRADYRTFRTLGAFRGRPLRAALGAIGAGGICSMFR